jgi:hypothetical protein
MSNKRITLDSTVANATETANFAVRFSIPISLEGLKWNIALCKLTTYYSWYNISAAIGNNTFVYNNGSVDRTLTLEDGTYMFEELVSQIQDLMVALGDYTVVSGQNVFDINFSLDPSDGFVTVLLTNGYSIDFTDLDIRTIFGADSAIYNTSVTFPNPADIRNGVDTILVHLDTISGNSYLNGNSSDVVYSFSPFVDANGIIDIEPSGPYVGVSCNNQIEQMRVYLTDQNNNPISLNGSPLTCVFILESIK